MITNKRETRKQWGRIYKNRTLYMLFFPVFFYVILFNYVPMFGVIIAFKDYKPVIGFFDSEWVGFKHFNILFRGVQFPRVMANTLTVTALRFVLQFPAPILLALMLNEVTNIMFKRVAQTAVYMPHFLSWVISCSLVMIAVDSDGFVVDAMRLFGYETDTSLLASSAAFYPIIIISDIWKEAGWGTLIYLAAIAGIDPSLYESAIIDGATRLKQMRYITLPSLMPTIIVLMILRCGSILNAGFEQIYLLQNSMNVDVSEVLDTYVYKLGLKDGKYSLSTAVGLFKSFVGMLLVLLTNALARKFGESSLL